MQVYDPQHDTPALQKRLHSHDGFIVACYCAAWCDTCRQYRPDYEALAKTWPQHTFLWIDIEESPELLDDEDVENFPTLLVQSKAGNLFYGTMLPFTGHLDKLLRSLEDAATDVIDDGPRPIGDLLPPAAK